MAEIVVMAVVSFMAEIVGWVCVWVEFWISSVVAIWDAHRTRM